MKPEVFLRDGCEEIPTLASAWVGGWRRGWTARTNHEWKGNGSATAASRRLRFASRAHVVTILLPFIAHLSCGRRCHLPRPSRVSSVPFRMDFAVSRGCEWWIERLLSLSFTRIGNHAGQVHPDCSFRWNRHASVARFRSRRETGRTSEGSILLPFPGWKQAITNDSNQPWKNATARSTSWSTSPP